MKFNISEKNNFERGNENKDMPDLHYNKEHNALRMRHH